MDLLTIVLATAMAWAGCLNVSGPQFIRDEFNAWGYSDSLRVSVGGLEWIAAITLVPESTRLIGCGIAMTILTGVLLTLLRQRKWMRLEYPVVLLALFLTESIDGLWKYGLV